MGTNRDGSQATTGHVEAPLFLGIDFGTTNSVIVVADAFGATRPVSFRFEGQEDSETCRTLLCLGMEEQRGRASLHEAIGAEAVESYLDDPTESRLIMSMKSYLAQASFRETRLFGRSTTLEELIARFLAALMRKAGIDPARVHATIGRPVRFAGENADDALGETRLRESFQQAGFADVRVALEPEGAGWRFVQGLTAPATVLVGDFGGGTSDFSVLRFDPHAARRTVTLGHAGVGIAGDQFDYRIIDRIVSPALGRDETYRVMGGAALPVPAEWYANLARWHRLSLMRTPATLRAIADVAKTASDPGRIRQLLRLIEDQAGQGLYKAVAEVKSALSRHDRARLRFTHRDLHIDEEVTRTDFEAWIAPDLQRMALAVDEALQQSGCTVGGIDHVFLTGGTSFVPAVRRLFTERFGAARVDGGSEFVSVAEGLALIGASQGL
ncbi:molecular chaperone DnaK [Neoasaia chiangmaiensis NBRC 101099]|uniref:Molecular chaperone DnaK n=1 Tax=Neoasaia chiangmaiensis TaxID=320497 RepID=A0A1U9KNI6_9PROT|nr:Hsp70 family protein [Neoasaia chiangmaiensis]AQS87367.1 molecular chaperone DnaK [Neoasaia chiangmaiensis]GBR42967.1 molecular chaperone DnaK [Neoasaia chiangmaiensis NBRC 101099]GEN16129.1 molecular chaperone Hsp70 [Neoasaia chiangmaiensis]